MSLARSSFVNAARLAACIAAVSAAVLLRPSTPAQAARTPGQPNVKTPARFAAVVENVVVPIRQSASSNIGPGSSRSFNVTVDIDSAPSGTGYVQITTDHNSLMTSPSGSWPYNLTFAPGDPTSKTITITSGNPSSNTSVVIGACESDYNASNSANWQVTSTVTVYP